MQNECLVTVINIRFDLVFTNTFLNKLLNYNGFTEFRTGMDQRQLCCQNFIFLKNSSTVDANICFE